jgi:thiamine biosynthesis protein ThiI
MSNKIISLLSDGIDSPVAAYLMMKKGFVPIFLTFITTEAQREEMKAKIRKIVHRLKTFSAHKIKLYFIPHTDTLTQIIRTAPRKLTCVLCKRIMYRIAMRIGEKEGTNIIMTGDILGEQASQTLSNLQSYHSLFEKYIKLSPLIGLNKMDVTRINKEIGVYEICSKKLQSCQFFPQYPETNTKIPELTHAENLMDLDNLIKVALSKAEIVKL